MRRAHAQIMTTAEIRTLIAKLLLRIQNHPAFVWACLDGDDNTKPTPQQPTKKAP